MFLERFGEDVPAQRKKLEAALNLLEQQTYIQRNGDLYEYLTDEEKDVEEEIKNTEVETADVIKELEDLLRQDSTQVEPALHVFSAARNVEQVADHAENIAEEVIYMIDGEIIRHKHTQFVRRTNG